MTLIKEITDAEYIAADGVGTDPDLEAEFDELREALNNAEKGGKVNVYRVPLDDSNNPMPNAKHQIQLFSFPVGQMDLENVIAKVKRDYMLPTENFITIRLIGVQPGLRGTRFNRIVTIQRANSENKSSTSGPENRESVAAILRAIQETNSQQLQYWQAFFQRTQPQQGQKDPLEMAIAMMSVMAQMVGNLSKGAPATAAPTLLEQIQTMKALKDLSGELIGDSNMGDDNSVAGILKAVTPLALPVLQTMAAQAPARPPLQGSLAAPRPVAPISRPNAPVFTGAPEIMPQSVNPSPPVESARPNVIHLPDEGKKEMRPENSEKSMLTQLIGFINDVLVLAEKNVEPSLAAEIILDSLSGVGDGDDEKVTQKLLELLDDDKWLKKIVALEPKANVFSVWLTSVRDSILAQFEESASDEPITDDKLKLDS